MDGNLQLCDDAVCLLLDKLEVDGAAFTGVVEGPGT